MLKYICVAIFLFNRTSTNAQFIYLPNPLGSEKAANSRIVNGIVVDNNSNLYFTTHWNEDYNHDRSSSGGLYRYVQDKWIAQKVFKGSSSWEDFGRLSISEDKTKIAYLASLITPNSWRMMLSFDISNPAVLVPIKTPENISNVFTDTKFDKGNNLWFSMGLGRHDGQIVKLCQQASNEIRCFTSNQTSDIKSFSFYDENQLIMNSGRGYLNKLNIENSKREVFDDLVSYSNPSVPISSSGAVYYIGESAKLGVVQNGNKSQVSLPVETKVICAFAASNGKVLLGTHDGLLTYNNGKWTILNTTNSNLKGNRITALSEDSSGQIWLAGVEKGSTKTFICQNSIK